MYKVTIEGARKGTVLVVDTEWRASEEESVRAVRGLIVEGWKGEGGRGRGYVLGGREGSWD